MGQIGRVGILAANAVLGVLCVFFLHRVITPLLAEWVDPPGGTAVAAPEPASAQPRTWEDREIILERNLFHASTVEPAAPPPQEELEATSLPLELLGTAAAERPAVSLAVVLDTEQQEHEVVGLGDQVAGRATVVRIEPRRLVLRNGSRLEELVLEEDEDGTRSRISTTARRPVQRAARRAEDGRRAPDAGPREEALQRLGERIRRLSEDRFSVPRSDVEAAARNPANLFSQARIIPRYEEGEMVGLQVNAIQSGSLFEQIGIEDGDTVLEFNGIEITSAEQSAALLRELTDAREFDVVVMDRDGRERTLTYQVEGE